MGLLSRFFKTDPREALEKAEALLARGDAAAALRLAEKALNGGSLAQTQRAESLLRRIKESLVETALAKAEQAESSGFLDDAAEWITAALDHVDDDDQRAELEARAAQFLEGAEHQRKIDTRIDFARMGEDIGEGDELKQVQVEPDPDNLYDALINTLDDDIADRYENRPEAFRHAVVALYEGPGRALEALPALEELAAAHPGDPVYQLERGRARLLTGDLEGAREDFEAVWETFGDEPLDHAASLSVPALWAEAQLKADRVEELLERLDEVAVPSEADSNLCYHYALALMKAERLEDARLYLMAAMDRFSQPEFPHQLGAVLFGLGRKKEAIDVLERAIAPSCTPASCRQVPKHVPSLRSLIGLYIDQGQKFDRVEQLFGFIAQAQQGQMEGEDYLILARFHEARGDEEAAREAMEQAKEIYGAAQIAPG